MILRAPLRLAPLNLAALGLSSRLHSARPLYPALVSFLAFALSRSLRRQVWLSTKLCRPLISCPKVFAPIKLNNQSLSQVSRLVSVASGGCEGGGLNIGHSCWDTTRKAHEKQAIISILRRRRCTSTSNQRTRLVRPLTMCPSGRRLSSWPHSRGLPCSPCHGEKRISPEWRRRGRWHGHICANLATDNTRSSGTPVLYTPVCTFAFP